MLNNRFASFHNYHRNQAAIIVANGPSLNKTDLNLIRSYPTIGLNKIFLGFNDLGFYPRYYAAVNDLVIEQSEAEIKRLNCVKFISKRNSKVIPEDALTYHINTCFPPAKFCKDIQDGVNEGGTVTYVALQIAYYLGFKTVIIVGMDHNFAFTGNPNETHTIKEADPNHFSSAYFGYGQKWDNPDLEKSEKSYALARRVYEADGRSILDATIGGKCTIFEKVDYDEYFKKNFS
jgi:hypothetical protein|tara:strand:+ start:1055 stop:1753 length:699 start_codon:yes stop_codon:yes gene_type:complete